MRRRVIKSWEELRTFGRKIGGTHWNYTSAQVRFRGAMKQPIALDRRLPIEPDVSVRVRFYAEVDGELIERPLSEVPFRPCAEPTALQRRPDSPLTATASPPRNVSAEPPNLSANENRQAEPSPPASIKDGWEFLAHPDSERMIKLILRHITQDEERAEVLTKALRALPDLLK